MSKHSFFDFEQHTYNFAELENELAAVPTAANSSYYKCFAYRKENQNPIILFGNSENDIILKLQKYNQARIENEKFISCNIGELNLIDNTCFYYKKFNVITGLEISPIPLNIPAMHYNEFKKVTTTLKKLGACFNGLKKEWYVTEDMNLSDFKDYLDLSNTSNTSEKYEVLNEKILL